MRNPVCIDPATCAKCGVCVEVCPAGLLVAGAEGVPVVSEESAACVRCGHCEAFCPTGAVRCEYNGDYPTSLAVSSPATPEQMKQLMRGRRTTRRYQQKAVARAVIEDLLDTVRFAPSGMNAQPLSWIVVEKVEDMEKIAEAMAEWMRDVIASEGAGAYTGFFRKCVEEYEQGKRNRLTLGAPHLLVATVPVPISTAQTDAHIALSWFELLSQTYGLGTCWLGLLRWAVEANPEIATLLGVPEGYRFAYAMAFGYRAHDPVRPPKRKPVQVAYL